MLRRPAPAVLLALALAAGACSDPGPAPTPTPQESISEIRDAREAVEEPAVDLHVAAQRVVAAVEALRAAEVADPTHRLATLEDPPGEAFEGLEEAIGVARDVHLAGDAAAVSAAQESLVDAADAAADTLEAGRADIASQIRAAEAHAVLLSLAARWEEPGSRSQQLDRFAALAAEADSLAGELSATDPVAPCLTEFQRRAAAARHVADATRELRGHVEAYRGSQFDALRAELAEDPFGLERPLVEADLAELDCWREEAPVVGAAARVEAALARLEAALNPPQDPAGP